MTRMNDVPRWQRLAACLVLLVSGTAYGNEAPSATEPGCAEGEFDTFLQRFARDLAFQRRNTALPLPKLAIDANAQPEPKPVEISIATWPSHGLFPSAARIEADSLSIETVATKQGRLVHLKKADTDYLVDFLFEHRSCWTLVRIEDFSL